MSNLTDDKGCEGFGAPIILERTGSPPIKFHGALIADGESINDRKDDRGYAVRIYETRTADGGTRYVMQIEYRTKWRSEANGFVVMVADSGRELTIKLLAYDPMYFVVGYPPGERFFEKRRRLEATLRNQYMSLVSGLLTKVPAAAVGLDHATPDG